MEALKETYFTDLLSQGAGNMNICPTCFANGRRARYCPNAVVLMPQKVLVCCYLGDKNEISKAKFKKKVREMKK